MIRSWLGVLLDAAALDCGDAGFAGLARACSLPRTTLLHVARSEPGARHQASTLAAIARGLDLSVDDVVELHSLPETAPVPAWVSASGGSPSFRAGRAGGRARLLGTADARRAANARWHRPPPAEQMPLKSVG